MIISINQFTNSTVFGNQKTHKRLQKIWMDDGLKLTLLMEKIIIQNRASWTQILTN